MGGKIHRNSLKPGYKLHWYEINTILGQGGFGITYLAFDTNLKRDVAIKEYLPIELAVRENDFSVHPVTEDRGKQYKWGLDRFISEAQTLAKFEHPNIVKVLTVFEENNTGYMIMPYEQGQSLQQRLSGKKTLEEAELLKIVIPILGGLEQVHQSGFIHRDIKPDNIFIRYDGSPVLLDFGSARQAMGEETKTLTSLVSPGYAPFEQYYSKSDEQGPWTDIYGLGATLYRAIAGIAPMDAVDRSKAILEDSHDVFVPAVEVGKGKYSRRFLTAVDHSLQFKKQDRPQTIHEWKQEFGVAGDLAEIKRLEQREQTPTQPGTQVIRKRATRRPRPATVLLLITLITSIMAFYYRTALEESIRPYLPEPKVVVMTAEESKRIEQKSALVRKRIEEQQAQLEKYQAIAQLLQEAEAHFILKRFIEPSGQNALEVYLKVLELEPGNRDAITGQDRIFQHYLTTADNFIAEHKFDEAESALLRADVIKPDSMAAKLARVRLNDARLAAERMAIEQQRKRKAEENKRLAELQLLAEKKKRRQEKARLVELERQRQEEEEKKQNEQEQRNKYTMFITAAEQAFSNKDKARAIKKYKEALVLYPGDVDATLGLKNAESLKHKLCYEVLGKWIWDKALGKDIIILHEDGTIDYKIGRGSWECTDPENRIIKLRLTALGFSNEWLSEYSVDGTCLLGPKSWGDRGCYHR